MKKKTGYLNDSTMIGRGPGPDTNSAILLSALILFIISVLYFNIPGKGLLFHQERNSLFIYSSDFFMNFADKPGGILVYAGHFLTQFYHNVFPGSLLNSILLASVFLVISGIVRVLGAEKPLEPVLALIPAGALMLLQTRYDFQAYNLIGYLFVLLGFRLALSSEKLISQLIVAGLLLPFYYLAGSFVLVFAGLYFVYFFFKPKNKSWWVPPVFIALFWLAVFLVFRNLLFFQTGKKLLLYPLFLNETHRLTVYILLLNIYLVILPVIIRFTGNLLSVVRNPGKFRLITMIAFFTILIALLSVFYDRVTEDVMRVEKLAQERNWDMVVREQEKLQSTNIVIQYYYNLALSEKGELCSRMFYAPQTSGSFSLTLSRDGEQVSRSMYFYYAVGLTAEAHHLAYESMVQHGYRPENIKMLIRTELINENFPVAEKYLNVLKRTLFYREWAFKYARLLYRPDLVAADPELGPEMKLIPSEDFFVVSDDFRNIQMLLKVNPGNRIAFEYKLAKLMLEKDLLEVGTEIKNLKEMGYTRIPRHIEEAVIYLVNITKEFPDMGGLLISRETEQRFLKYFNALKSFSGDMKLAGKGLNKTERNTFWYYMQFGHISTDFKRSAPVDYSIY